MGVDAGRRLSAVALGKLAEMPYEWLPRRDPPVDEPRNDRRRHPIGATANWWQFLTTRIASVRAHSSVGRAADS